MKKIAILSLLVMLCFAANASTTITTSTVSGHWTLAGSPYIIKNDITVNSGQMLTIDPGVEVIFNGAFQFNVYGSLYAVGTSTSFISFHVADTTGWYDHTTVTGGWKGLNLYPLNHATDSCAFSYCRISDTKFAAIQFYKLNLTLSYCEFFHNNYFNNGHIVGGLLDSAGMYQFTMDHCMLHDNISNIIAGADFGKISIHDCSFYNNTTNDLLTIEYSKMDIFRNVFRDNTSTYTIVHVKSSEGSIRHNVVHHNIDEYEAAVSLYSCNGADINGNLIVNNQATLHDDGGLSCYLVQGGGGIRIMGDVDSATRYHFLIRNNVIANNYSALAGGAIYIYDAGATIVNNDIIYNKATQGGGIYMINSPSLGHSLVKIKNNIFHNNFSNAGLYNVYMEIADSVQYDYNCSQTGITGDVIAGAAGYNTLICDTPTNVIFPAVTGPGLIHEPDATGANAMDFDFRLLPTSIVINKGDTTGAFVDIIDCDNQQRIYGSTIDIGAFEFSPAELAHTGIGQVEVAAPHMFVSPNPATNLCTVKLSASAGLLEVVDAMGRLVARQQVSSNTESIDLSRITSGVYFVSWSDANGLKLNEKLVIAR